MKAAAAYSFTIFSRNGSDAAQIIPLYGSFLCTKALDIKIQSCPEFTLVRSFVHVVDFFCPPKFPFPLFVLLCVYLGVAPHSYVVHTGFSW